MYLARGSSISKTRIIDLPRDVANKMAPPPEKTEKKESKRNSLLANALSSAIGGMVHACVEQPVTTPVEASITQMQINGRGFFHNFRQLYGLGVWNGLYRAFPTAMAGAAPKAVVHYGFLNYWINFYTKDGDIRSATKKESALIGFSTGASEVLITSPINFVKFR
jgi:hypothetical protein